MKTINTGRGGRRSYKADASICMVPDCVKKAIYRHRSSNRGYCSAHKDEAVESIRVVSSNADGFISRFKL